MCMCLYGCFSFLLHRNVYTIRSVKHERLFTILGISVNLFVYIGIALVYIVWRRQRVYTNDLKNYRYSNQIELFFVPFEKLYDMEIMKL